MTARAVAGEGLATRRRLSAQQATPWRFAQRCATNPTPFNNVRTKFAPAWRGADGLARRLRPAMHLPAGPQAHNARYANAPRSGALAPGVKRVCIMRHYVKCMAASAAPGREQNARPSTARRSSYGQAERAGGRDVQGRVARRVSGRSEAKPRAARCRAAAAPKREKPGSRQQGSTTRNRRARQANG